MPRIRSIKPEHWDDKNLPKISLGAHLLWISMWNFSDDKGVIENDCYLIKSNSFPRRKEIKPVHIRKWVDELIKYHFVIPFQYNDIQYLVHRTFDVHQKIDKPQKSKIDENLISTLRRSFVERSANTPRTIDDHSEIIRRKDRIGEDKDRIGEDSIGEDTPVFSLQTIYNKKFEELNGHFKDMTPGGFEKWKHFVDFVRKKNFTELFRCKFVRPQDFEKMDFPENKWEEVLRAILSTGVKAEHDLFFRIPEFIKYKEPKNGLNNTKGSASTKGGGVAGTNAIEPDKQYSGLRRRT